MYNLMFEFKVMCTFSTYKQAEEEKAKYFGTALYGDLYIVKNK